MYNFGYEEKRNNRQIEQDEISVARMESVLEILAEEINTLDDGYLMSKNLRYNFKAEWDEFG